ncbi:hypothetical protein BY996DRAFT_8391264 [Phakopsora pachyrhizi]|nr:hypothetical protein BY996DRAFT_8391264 [Phakopsora pachyrhizi]
MKNKKDLRDALKSWEKEFGTAEDRSTEEGVRGVTAGRDRAAVGGAEDELLASAAEMGDANGPELAGELCGVGFEGMRIDGQVYAAMGSQFTRITCSTSDRITEDCGMGMTPTGLGFRGEMKLGALDGPQSSLEEAGIGFMKMGNFLSTVFQEVASGAYDSCKSYLKEKSIPSLSKMNYNQKGNYCPDDFSSAITYTINDFCNKAHVDNDTVNWTLIGFIPIKKDGDLAFEDFDVEGGEFVIRNLKVFIDLPKVKGITLVVLKTNKLKHQTIPSKSTSGLFTRFGFSCQISKNMSITMKKYHRDHYEDKNHSFGNYDDYIIKG